MDETLRDLRRVVDRGPAGRRGFPEGIRRRAAEWARAQRAAGEPLLALARRLGVSHETLRRWLRKGEVGFRPVSMSEAAARAPASRGAVIRLAGGVVVEGLSVEEVVVVLRALS